MLRLSLGALAFVAALAVPLAATAQSAPAPAPGQAAPPQAGHRHHHGSRYMHAMRGLNLSDDQKSQIRSIMKSTRQANLNNGQPVDPQTRKQNAIAMRQQIDHVLSDTQRAQLHANLRAQRHAGRAGSPAGPGAGQQPAPNQ